MLNQEEKQNQPMGSEKCN